MGMSYEDLLKVLSGSDDPYPSPERKRRLARPEVYEDQYTPSVTQSNIIDDFIQWISRVDPNKIKSDINESSIGQSLSTFGKSMNEANLLTSLEKDRQRAGDAVINNVDFSKSEQARRMMMPTGDRDMGNPYAQVDMPPPLETDPGKFLNRNEVPSDTAELALKTQTLTDPLTDLSILSDTSEEGLAKAVSRLNKQIALSEYALTKLDPNDELYESKQYVLEQGIATKNAQLNRLASQYENSRAIRTKREDDEVASKKRLELEDYSADVQTKKAKELADYQAGIRRQEDDYQTLKELELASIQTKAAAAKQAASDQLDYQSNVLFYKVARGQMSFDEAIGQFNQSAVQSAQVSNYFDGLLTQKKAEFDQKYGKIR